MEPKELRKLGNIRRMVTAFMTWPEMFGNGAAIGIGLIIIRSLQLQGMLLEIQKVRKNHMIQGNQEKKNVCIAAVHSFALINTALDIWSALEAKVKLAVAVI